jgi:hypothetical protein
MNARRGDVYVTVFKGLTIDSSYDFHLHGAAQNQREGIGAFGGGSVNGNKDRGIQIAGERSDESFKSPETAGRATDHDNAAWHGSMVEV